MQDTKFVFPLAIKLARKAQGLSQEKLADLLGVTRPRVVQMESGKRGLREDVVLRVCQALKLSVSELAMFYYDSRVDEG